MLHAAPGFNFRLLYAMHEVGLESADELAKAINVPIPTALILMSRSTPVVDGLTLIRICNVTHFSDTWLMCAEGPPRRLQDNPEVKRFIELVSGVPEDRQPLIWDRCLEVIHSTA